MSEELRSIVLGTAGLSVAAVVAVLLTVTRAPPARSAAEIRGGARLAGVAWLVQCAHFAEELAAGFHERFPAQLGLVPWPPAFFVAFNVFWLGAWALACRGLVAGSRLALAALWFLGLAAAANGIAHPLLAARVGGYFPGLVTALALGVVGVLLLRRLEALTRRRP